MAPLVRFPLLVAAALGIFLAPGHAANTSTNPSDSVLRHEGSAVFEVLPTKYEAYESGDSNCEWAFWDSDVYDMEAVHCRAGAGVYYVRSYMTVEGLLPGWPAWVANHKGTIKWLSKPRTLEGAMGPVAIRDFTIWDGAEYPCTGYVASWGSLGSGVRNAITGYLCTAGNVPPSETVVRGVLGTLSLKGSFDSLVGGQ